MGKVYKYCKIVSRNDSRSFDVFKIVRFDVNVSSSFYSLIDGKVVSFKNIDKAMIYFRDLFSCDVGVVDYVY